MDYEPIPTDRLKHWKDQISIEGRTEFNHNHVMPMIKEILELRNWVSRVGDVQKTGMKEREYQILYEVVTSIFNGTLLAREEVIKILKDCLWYYEHGDGKYREPK